MLIEKTQIKRLPRIGKSIGFKFDGNKCFLVVYNEFSYFASEIEVEEDSIPDFFVDMKLFLSIINTVGDVEVSIQETHIDIADGTGSNFKLPKKNGFLNELVKLDWEQTISLSEDFTTHRKHLLSTSSEQPTLDYKEGIFFSSDILASTDGVTITVIDNTEFDLEEPQVLHRQFVSNIEGESFIYMDHNSMHFCKEGFRGGSLALADAFPDVVKVESGVEYIDNFTVSGSELTGLLTKSKALVGEFDLLHLCLADNKLRADFEGQSGEFKSELDVESTRDIDFHINMERLLKVVKPFGGMDIQVWFADNKTPIKVVGDTVRKIIALSIP